MVTGASAGIGLALARELSRRGRPVLAVARRAERLRALAMESRAEGDGEIHLLEQDVRDPAAAGRILDAARSLGGASVLVNNAGLGQYGRFEDAAPERLADMLRTNCEALVLLTHAFLPELRAAGSGMILNVASAAAFQPTPFMAVYGATKAFVLSFTEAISEELRGTGVRVGAFCPGPVSTEFGEVAGTRERFRNVPGVLTAESAAREALAQVDRGEVVRVPHPIYKLTTAASGVLPRAITRRVSARVNRPTERT